MVDKEVIGKNIKRARVEAGKSQLDLSSELFISERNYRRWEDEGTTDLDKIMDVATALNINWMKLVSNAIN